MSKLNHLYNAEKNTLCYQMHQKWGDNLLKVCPSIQWSLSICSKSWLGAVVVAQLVDRSLPSPEIRGSNRVIGILPIFNSS